MNDAGVRAGFDLTREEIEMVARELRDRAKATLDAGDFDAAQAFVEVVKKLSVFGERVQNLQRDWESAFGAKVAGMIEEAPRFPPEPPAGERATAVLRMAHGSAQAQAEFSARRTRLLPGSTICKTAHGSLARHIASMRRDAVTRGQLRESGGADVYELTAPLDFGSPSGAAQFVAGCSVSGPREWLVKGSGQSLKSWLEHHTARTA